MSCCKENDTAKTGAAGVAQESGPGVTGTAMGSKMTGRVGAPMAMRQRMGMCLEMPGAMGRAAAAAATAALTPVGAWAQTPPGSYGYGPQMMWGWGWYGMIFGPLFMILMLAVVITAVVLAVRWLGGPWQAPSPHSPPGRTAIDILNERLARGEIDHAEYEAKRRLIAQS